MAELGTEVGSIEDLPRIVPIFPLSGVLLLPRGSLPLNIFEKRYIQMTQDVMGSHRMIGMVQPADPGSPLETPDVYLTGCLGRITSFSETPDSRFLITLSGVCRFEIVREIGSNGVLYRQACVDYRQFAHDLPTPKSLTVDRDQLMPALKSYFDINGLTANWDAIHKADDMTLITCLAMACPFEASEKQALLECASEPERLRMVQTLFEMAAHEHKGSSQTFQ